MQAEENFFCHSIVKIIKEVLSYFLIFVFVFGLSVFRFGMHYDEVLDYFGQAQGTYLVMSRSGIYLYRLIMGEGANMWSAPLVAGLFLSIAIFLQTRLFSISSKLSKFIFAGMVLSSYQLIYVLRYSMQCDAVALTYILVTCAAYIILKSLAKTPYRIFLAIVLLTCSLCIYQSSLLYFVAIVLIVFILNILEIRKLPTFKQLLSLAFVVILAIIIWLCITKITSPLVSNDIKSYVETYYRMEAVRKSSFDLSPLNHLISILYYIKTSFSQALYLVQTYQGYFYLQTVSYLYVSVLIPLIYLFVYLFRNYRFSYFIVGSAFLVCLWVSPYMLNVALRGLSGIHSWLAEPLILGILWTLAYRYRPNVLRSQQAVFSTSIVIMALVSFCLLKNCYRVSTHERYMAHYAELLKKTLFQIEQYQIDESIRQGREVKIVLVHSAGENEIISTGYNFVPFYQIYNIKNIRSAKQDDITLLQDRMKSLPNWPSPLSIKNVESEIYIKVPHLYAGEIPTSIAL